jgi:hypothetical protein
MVYEEFFTVKHTLLCADTTSSAVIVDPSDITHTTVHVFVPSSTQNAHDHKVVNDAGIITQVIAEFANA